MVSDLNSKLVYSTALGSICPGCGQGAQGCVCQSIKKSKLPQASALVRIRYELNGRKGKGVTVITGLGLSENNLLDLAKKLKQLFGTGGAVKDYVILLQGDFCQQAASQLRKLGYNVK